MSRLINYPEIEAFDEGDILIVDGDEGTRKITAEKMAKETIRLGAEDIAELDSIKAIEASIEDLDERKANVDGYYENLGAGIADQLNSTQLIEDNAPYLYRKSGGAADIGNREFKKIVGGSLGWNQLVYANGSATLNKDSQRTINISTNSKAPVENHVYLYSCSITDDTTAGGLNFQYGVNKSFSGTGKKAVIDKASSYSTPYVYAYIGNGEASGTTLTYENFNIIDLTQMFGATIADYIYSLEQAATGAGVAWVKRYLTKDYYAYDAGSIKSVEGLESHDTVGFNQWDEEWEQGEINTGTGANSSSTERIRSKNYILISPDWQYYAKTPANLYLFFYDAEKNYIGFHGSSKKDSVFRPYELSNAKPDGTSFENAVYMRFRCDVSTYNHDVCINISDPSRNGEYEPYTKHSYALDDSLTLRGIPKLDSSGHLYYDGDTYESDGTVTRKYGIVDLGTLTWSYRQSGYNSKPFYAHIDNIKVPPQTSILIQAIISKGYEQVAPNKLNSATIDKAFGIGIYFSGDNEINIIDTSFTDATTFKTAMSGVYLVYELATPTTEEAEPFVSPQIVDNYGTEEFVTDCLIPIGHVTQYPANLRDKLQHLPNMADTEDDYVIRQNSTGMELIPARLDRKANVDGQYEGLVSGGALQLVSTVFEEDQVPYKFRTSGGSIDIGDREEDMIVGGTIGWNQLADIVSTSASHYLEPWASTLERKTHGVIATSVRTYTSMGFPFVLDVTIRNTHKYLMLIDLVASSFTPSYVSNELDDGWTRIGLQSQVLFSGYKKYGNIVNATGDGTAGTIQRGMFYVGGSVVEGSTCEIANPIIIDLTLLLGPTIADYIYSLEQANAGAGVAWFKKFFPKDYYPYNAGEMKSVEGLESHDLVGFNAWDEEWELGAYNNTTGEKAGSNSTIRSKNHISILPNTQYYFKIPTGTPRVFYYDANKNYLDTTLVSGNTVFTTPANAHFMNFHVTGTTYNHDICINLSWDGERDGEYEAYEKRSYPLDSSLVLRGIPNLDENNQLYYDGDTYESDGTVTRYFAEYTIKDSDVTLDTTVTYENIVYAKISYLPSMLKSLFKNCIHSKYGMGINGWPFDNDEYIGKMVRNAGSRVFWFGYAIGTTESQMKSDLAGTTIVYELETPTTEEADPFHNPQIVDDFGTEEYVTDSIVPVGHYTKYQPNLRAKLEMAPASPDGDGDYIMRQANGENTYVPLVKELPAAPTTAGSYVLKCTVVNGTPTFTWEEEE